MKLFHTLLLVLTASLFCLGYAACGDDDDAEDAATATEEPADEEDESSDDDDDDTQGRAGLDSYFAEMETIGTRTDEDLETISEELQNATFETDEEEIAGLQSGLSQTGEVLEVALLDASALNPPPEVEDAHANFVETLQAVAALTSQLLSDTETATNSEELNALVEQYNADLATADDEFDEACLTLQGIADEEGIDRDIQCGDD